MPAKVSDGLREVSHDELVQRILMHYKIEEMGVPPKVNMHIWGAMGIGKSYTVHDAAQILAKEHKLKFSDSPNDTQGLDDTFVYSEIRAAQIEPTDVLGLPDLVGEYTDWKPPKLLPIRGRGILFLDEMNRAMGTIRSALYSYLDRGVLGRSVKPKGWLVVAAGNRLEDKVQVEDLEATLANRFCHYTLKIPHAKYWIEHFALHNNVDVRIIGFLSWMPKYLYDYKPNQRTEYAVATPRSWEFASRILQVSNDPAVVSSAVGDGIGITFETFCSMMEELNIERLMAGEIKWPEEAQKAYALTTAIAEWYEGKKTNLEEIFKYSLKVPPEYGILMITLTQHLGGEPFKKQVGEMLVKHKEVASRFGKYLYTSLIGVLGIAGILLAKLYTSGSNILPL